MDMTTSENYVVEEVILEDSVRTNVFVFSKNHFYVVLVSWNL